MSLELVLSAAYLTQLSLYNYSYIMNNNTFSTHEKHKRTKNKIRIKTINHFIRILPPAGQVDACSSEDLKSCKCEYEDQRARMRHLLATVLHDDSNITVKTSQIHRLSWAKGTAALSDTSTHYSLQTSINTEYQFLFFHQNVFILHRKIIFSLMLLTKILAFSREIWLKWQTKIYIYDFSSAHHIW